MLCDAKQGGLIVEQHRLKSQYETEQYHDQANLVYLGTLVFTLLFTGIFFFWVKSPLLAGLNFFASLVSLLAMQLNRVRRYAMGSLVFISTVSVIAAIETSNLGRTSGFHYIFFVIAGLIMYTSWQPKHKLLAELSVITLFGLVYFVTYDTPPPVKITYAMSAFFHSFNILMNIIGIANSAYYYSNIMNRAHKKISSLASRDYLTHLMNRTAFDEYVADLFQDCQTRYDDIGILFLDIDHFKRINDTCGHLCGDEILRQFATILTKLVPPTDFISRYGGEEFVVLSKVSDPIEVETLAESIRREVQEMHFVYEGETRRTSISIGALYVPHNMEVDYHHALQHADRLLYRAKNEGRNRVVFEHMKVH